MDEKMSAAEFNTLLHHTIAPHTKDKLIEEISLWLIDTYEDIGTNRLQSVCAYWKFFNRIRLLLASDIECLPETPPQRTSFVQWFGGLLLLTIAVLAIVIPWLHFGLAPLVCLYAYFLTGVVLFMLFLFHKSAEAARNPLYAEYPFESFADLLAVRRSVPDFLSKRFPNKPPIPAPSQNRVIRFLWDTKCPAWVDRVGDAFMTFLTSFALLLFLIAFWPLAVLLSFLARDRHTRLALPHHSTIDSPT